MLGEVPNPHEMKAGIYPSVTQYSPDEVDDLVKVQVSIEMEKYEKRIKEEDDEKKKKKKQQDKDINHVAYGGGFIVGGFMAMVLFGIYCWFSGDYSSDEFPEHLYILSFAFGSVGILLCCCGVRSCRKWRRTPTYIAQHTPTYDTQESFTTSSCGNRLET